MNNLFLIIFLAFSLPAIAQSYAPAAGQAGSTAIHMSATELKGWATGIHVERGYVNIEDTTMEANGQNRASFGDGSFALGPSTGATGDVVSLGDKGSAILTFDQPIFNGPGFDFAIFENSFSDTYLEFAHVEVSSNGVDFVRFPSHIEVQNEVQIHGFGTTDPRMVYNLAGKYRAGYGTPFDLEELKDSSGLNVNNITHIRVIDVVGSVGDSATFDAHGNKINEPFSTPYESGGFDLEAVGVINQLLTLTEEGERSIQIFPNPAHDVVNIHFHNKQFNLKVYSSAGELITAENGFHSTTISLSPGLYFFHISTKDSSAINKVIFH